MISTDHLVTIAQDPAATRPLPAEAPAPAPAADEPLTRRLPPLTLGQRWELWLRITSDRVHRGVPWLVTGAGVAIAALIGLLLLAPAGPAQAIVLARPTAPPVLVTATPSLVESLAVAAPPTAVPPPPTAEPAPIVVYVAPTAEPAPVELQPVQPVVVVQAQPTPAELTRIEPAGDGGTWIIEERPGGVSDAIYVPPPAPPGLAAKPPAPTPHFGEMKGGGGGWGD